MPSEALSCCAGLPILRDSPISFAIFAIRTLCAFMMSDPGPYALAVDLGTSGPKAAVISLQGHIASRGRAHV